MRRKKAWSQIVTAHGISVRLYERPAAIYREVRLSDGRKDRKSLGHRDRDKAVEEAKALAKELVTLRLAGQSGEPITFGELRSIYLAHKILKPGRRQFMEQTLELFARSLEPAGRPFRMDDFGPTQAEAYLEARRTGRIKRDNPRASDSPRAGTLANELQALSAICNWAVRFKQNGRRLLNHNPVHDVALPREENPHRPVATVDRLDRLLAVSDAIDPRGQFRLMLHLAAGTGRRISAILHLRRSDLLFGEDQVRAGLAAAGWPEGYATEWPNAVHWRAEHDKKGQAWVSPLPDRLRAAVEAYTRRAAVVGDAWLFPSAKDPEKPTPPREHLSRAPPGREDGRPSAPGPRRLARVPADMGHGSEGLPHLRRHAGRRNGGTRRHFRRRTRRPIRPPFGG